MRYIFTSLFSLALLSLGAVALNLPVNAQQNGGAGLMLMHQSPANFRINPASQFNGVETSATQLFGLAELPYYSIHASKILSRWGIGIGASWLDSELYQEMVSTLALSSRLDDLQIGISLNYISVAAKGFKKIDAFSLDVGLVWQINSFSTAVSLKNVSESEISNTKLPVNFLWESCWSQGKSKLSLGLEKEKDYDFSFKFGSLYQLNPLFGIIGSYQFEPNRIGAGAIFSVKKYELIYSFRTHKQLDITHYVSLSFNY